MLARSKTKKDVRTVKKVSKEVARRRKNLEKEVAKLRAKKPKYPSRPPVPKKVREEARKGIVGKTVGFDYEDEVMLTTTDVKKPTMTEEALAFRDSIEKKMVGDSFKFKFPYEEPVKLAIKNVPRCKGCGFEFKLLTAMGIKEVDMYCLHCEHVRDKLGHQIKDWHEMDKRIKARILPKVKGNSWMEQTKCSAR